MSTTRRILTLHSPIRPEVLDQLLSAIEESLVGSGARRVWIDPESTHDLVVMAELEDLGLPAGVPLPRVEDEIALADSLGAS